MTQPPRHVFLSTDAVGGVWTYSLGLGQELRTRGVDVALAVVGPGPDDSQRAACARFGIALIDTGCPLDWRTQDAGAIESAGRRLADLAVQTGADLVHLHAPSFAAARPFKGPVIGSCHSCMASWWDAVKGGEAPPDFAWRTALLAQGYEACDRLIAPSESFAAVTTAVYGVRPLVVWNGGGGVAAGADQDRRGGVVTSGRLWDEGKNIATLDRAAATVRGKVRAAGSLTGFDGQATALQNIEPLGHLDADHLFQRLGQTAIFASLALYEPFGLGVLEAAQAGCALVLSDIPTFKELWADAALFVPATDHAAAATAINALLGDPARRTQLGARAQARARRYGTDQMVDGVLAAYAAAMKPGAPVQEVAA